MSYLLIQCFVYVGVRVEILLPCSGLVIGIFYFSFNASTGLKSLKNISRNDMLNAEN